MQKDQDNMEHYNFIQACKINFNLERKILKEELKNGEKLTNHAIANLNNIAYGHQRNLEVIRKVYNQAVVQEDILKNLKTKSKYKRSIKLEIADLNHCLLLNKVYGNKKVALVNPIGNPGLI